MWVQKNPGNLKTLKKTLLSTSFRCFLSMRSKQNHKTYPGGRARLKLNVGFTVYDRRSSSDMLRHFGHATSVAWNSGAHRPLANSNTDFIIIDSSKLLCDQNYVVSMLTIATAHSRVSLHSKFTLVVQHSSQLALQMGYYQRILYCRARPELLSRCLLQCSLWVRRPFNHQAISLAVKKK